MIDTEKFAKFFDKHLISYFEKYFSGPEIHSQSILLITCLVSSYLIYRAIRKFIFPSLIAFSLRKNIELNRFITRYFIPMAYPVIAVLILFFGALTLEILKKNNEIVMIMLKLFALLSFLRFMRISVNSSFFANFIGVFLVPALFLDFFNLLGDVVNYLDEFAIKLGAIRISAYIVLKSIIVLMIVFWFANIFSKKSKSLVNGNKKIKISDKVIIGKFIDIFVYTSVGIIILKTVGVQMTTFAVLGGAIGVGIGFGLQKIASNFISGIILLFERSIEVGDWVEIDNGNILGIVKFFGGRYTLIECLDGKEIMVPNEDFIINRVNNWTYSNNRARVELNFAVEYGSDLEKTLDLTLKTAASHARCLSYPEPECYVEKFGEFDIKIVLYLWISDITKGRMSVRSDVYVAIEKALRENNIKIAIPKRDVRVFSGDK